MNGILLIDKPKGWTSFDVVNKVRRMVQVSPLNTSHKKRFPVGHTGTLDPLATGLLVLLLGTYTKKAPALTKFDKTYDVTMKLGITSTTGDEEGEKTEVSVAEPSREQLEQAFANLVGDIMQVPPAFSAIKINGQRAYKLAREGKVPEIQARPARIDYITITNYEYPFVQFTTHVSSGTYIRTLVEDAGDTLQTGAYMSDLRRTTVGTFDIADALTMEDLTPEKIQAALLHHTSTSEPSANDLAPDVII
jgi:tRNA pseudouridine55 synthase